MSNYRDRVAEIIDTAVREVTYIVDEASSELDEVKSDIEREANSDEPDWDEIKILADKGASITEDTDIEELREALNKLEQAQF